MRKTTILMMIAVTLGFSGCKSNSGDKSATDCQRMATERDDNHKGENHSSATSTHPHADRHQHDVRILRV